jgi:hypothetical protein
MKNTEEITLTDGELLLNEIMQASNGGNFEAAYRMLYAKVGTAPNAMIGHIERTLVKKELNETGKDVIHWRVWKEVKADVILRYHQCALIIKTSE